MKYLSLSAILLLAFALASCSSDRHRARQEQFNQWIEENGKVKVLCTTAIVEDLVKRVGKENIDTAVLIMGELDPHSYQLVKGDDEKLSIAQIIFSSGLGLEHGPSLHAYLKGSDKAISLGDSIAKRKPESIILIEGQRDPHIWMDVALWAEAIPTVVEALSQQDPVHKADYTENGKKAAEEMLKVDQLVRAMMQIVPNERRYLVSSHDAFNYFSRAYLAERGEVASGEWKKRCAAPEGLAPESQLSSVHIQNILSHLEEYNIRLIFPESNVNRDSLRKIIQSGREKGLDIRLACCSLFGDAMGEKGSEGETYEKMLIHNAKALSEQMSK